MKHLLALFALLLVVAVPAQASTPTGKLKSQLAVQKAKTASLQHQLVKANAMIAKQKATITTQTASIAALTGQVASLQGQLPPLNTTIANLTGANTALMGQVATLTGQVGTLTTQVSQQAAGGVTAIVASSPADQWNAIKAIWNVFPMEAPGGFCGFDKSNNIIGGTGLNIAEYTFEDDTNC